MVIGPAAECPDADAVFGVLQSGRRPRPEHEMSMMAMERVRNTARMGQGKQLRGLT